MIPKMPTRILFGNAFVFAILLVFVFGAQSSSISAQGFPMALQKDMSLSPRNKPDFEAWIKKYKAAICFDNVSPAVCSRSENAADEARDALVYATVSQIDLNFTKHERGRRHRKEIFQTLMDFLKLGADTAAVITNGARSKTIITAGSSLVQLFRQSAENNLRLKETQIIFNRMEGDRARALKTILRKLRGEPADNNANPIITEGVRKTAKDYPFEAAWIDLVAYYRAGTVDSALAGLAADTSDTKKKEEEKLTMLKNQ